VKEGSLLWRGTNCDIDIIRRYIDEIKCEKYDMRSVVEHSDRTMLLVAKPGMGKSTLLSYMAHEIKKWKPSVWVLRINLVNYTNELQAIDFEPESIDKCKMFLWSAAHSTEQDDLMVTKEIFLQALEQTGKMVIILDGFDEISPDYSDKVQVLIKAIRDKTASKIWISSRSTFQLNLEDTVGKFAFTLQPFTPENQIQFLEQYWSEVSEISNRGIMQKFGKQLLSLCSRNFSDKDGEFTEIPLQTRMLGEAFNNEAKEYCCSGEFNLTEKIDLLFLFKKITENKFDIYFKEKNKMDTSLPEVKDCKNEYVKKHMISALLYLFSLKGLNELSGELNRNNLEQKNCFLRKDKTHKIGIITDTVDGKPHFIHRCFAEYFAAKWFSDNFRECEEFISNVLFSSTHEEARKMFDRMLAEDSIIHDSILNNDIHSLELILKEKTNINSLDKGGRTALHLAASYNTPYIQQLLSILGTDANKPDEVLKWTPLRYADRTKSWMAMDILLQNGTNPDDIVFTRHQANTQEFGQAAVWECASKGHKKLLDFMLNCGVQVNTCVELPENFCQQFTLLHRASYCGQFEVVRLLVNQGASINVRDANKNTAVHLAAESDSVDIIKLLLTKGLSVNLTNKDDSTPLHIAAYFGHLKAVKALVEKGADINQGNFRGVTPLMMAASESKLEVFCYLTEIGAGINIISANKYTALHYAAESGSVDIIKLLLDKGMSVNLTSTGDFRPLHISANFGHLEATRFLVEKGAAINYKSEGGLSTLMFAAYSGKVEIVHYLTEIGADVNICDEYNSTALHLAAASGSVDIIRLLLDKGMSVNLTGRIDYTPLYLLAQFGHLEATKTLVELHADLNNTHKHGYTPLILAALSGNLEIFCYLTEIGLDINICDINKDTVIQNAAASGSVDIIKLLLDKEMSVNLTNADGYTPLHVSAKYGHLEATKYLVERGAAINSTNKYGVTPLILAAYNNKEEILLYLEEVGADMDIVYFLSCICIIIFIVVRYIHLFD
jgi:ankyrin repeat protein